MRRRLRRLIKTEDGIDLALRLLEQMIGAAAVSQKVAENLRRLIERRRIRFAVEASVDDAEVNTDGMTYENVLESLQDLVSEIDDPDQKRFATGVAAMLGSDKAAGKIKGGGGVARREGQVITAPQGVGMGMAAQTNGKQIEPVWLMEGSSS